jgi:hypothetical protein
MPWKPLPWVWTRTHLVYELNPDQQQRLAVARSRKVSVKDWLATLREYQAEAQRKGDQVDRTSLEGVLLRLEQFEKGQMLAQYGPGPDCIAIEDLGLLGPEDDPWGITVVEGGAEMDEFAKAALFSLMAVTIYQDAVIRRREMLTGKKFPPLQIIFEEANKVFSGVASSGGDDSRAASTAAIWESIFRDARKYKILLMVLAQTASQLPSGILSSCANIYIFQTKDARPRHPAAAHCQERKRHRQHGIQALPGAHPEDVCHRETGLQRGRVRHRTDSHAPCLPARSRTDRQRNRETLPFLRK